MIPYATFHFFLLLAVLLTPAVIAGLRGRAMKRSIELISAVLIVVIYSSSIIAFMSILLYTVWQTLLVRQYSSYRQSSNRAIIFYFAVLLTISPLILVKIEPLFQSMTAFGFLGISYLTFKSVQTVIEIRDGQIKKLGIAEFIRFLLFFPTITSGPIDRFRRFRNDSVRQWTKQEYRNLLYQGINKIFLGFLYKFIIGYAVNAYILETVFIREKSWLSNLAYMYAYSFYLFFDFAGYSAFAIGVSYLLGVKTPENFNKPFISRNIKDFWNRWHMTLSFWFRDYIYMRLVFLLTKKKVLGRYTISYLGYFTLFLTMGLWHGLHLHYIVYGLYHGALMTGFDLFERINKVKKLWLDRPWTRWISIFITFHVICFGFLIFSGRLFN